MLVKMKQLSKHYGALKAVQGIDLTIHQGETVGLIGKSGSGKTTLGKLILQLEKATAGTVFFDGKEISSFSKHQLKPIRQQMQYVSQDPYSSLNPKMRVGDVIAEGLDIHGIARGDRVEKLLIDVGLPNEYAQRYPKELSGGERQRVALARALALSPRFLVCDEPLASLDLATQMRILELLERLKSAYSLTLLFITHDLPPMRKFADTIAVMCRGQIIETCSAEAFFNGPQQPYSQILLSAVPYSGPMYEDQFS